MDGYPHYMIAADYDDWVTETVQTNCKTMHGLNEDILVWNPVTNRQHELLLWEFAKTRKLLRCSLKLTDGGLYKFFTSQSNNKL